MQTDHFRHVRFVKMATNRVPNIPVELFDGLGVGKYRLPQGFGRIAAFRCLLNKKKEFRSFLHLPVFRSEVWISS